MSAAIKGFFAAWSEPDAAKRRAAVEQAFAGQTSYADPRTPAPLTDSMAISDYIAMFVQAAPGARADVVSVDEQHRLIRATVAFRMADGLEQFGQYFVETDAEGHITRMVGFVGTGAPV